MPHDFIPRPDGDFNAWANHYYPAVKAWWDAHGLDTSARAPLEAALGRWQADYPAHVATRSAAEAARQAKDAARERARGPGAARRRVRAELPRHHQRRPRRDGDHGAVIGGAGVPPADDGAHRAGGERAAAHAPTAPQRSVQGQVGRVHADPPRKAIFAARGRTIRHPAPA